MQKLVFRNANGIELDLTSGDYGITEWEGFSAVDLNVQSQQVPFQDGSVYLDGLLGERELSVTVAMQDNNNLEKRYQLRRQMISVLNPKLGEGVLIYTNDYISKQIHCVAQMPVFENHNSNDSGTPKASCSFTACNPYWEDTEDTEINFNIGTLPRIENNGDVPTQVKIEFFSGGVINPTIENITAGKKIEYKAELEGGLLIDTNIGEKKVIKEDFEFDITEQIVSICDICAFKKALMYERVGYYGTLDYSLDGVNWKSLKSGTDETLYRIREIEELGIFIIVGANGVILKSQDGSNWGKVTSGTTEDLMGIAYSKTLEKIFVVGTDGTIIKSADGSNWESVTSGIEDTLTGIVYSESLDLLVAVGHNRTIIRSADGETWTRSVTTSSGSDFYDVTYSGKVQIFVAVGLNGISQTSSNGVTWVLQTPASTSIAKVVYSNSLSLFIEACGTISERSIVRVSSDGVNWGQPNTNITRASFNAVCYSEEMNLCIVGGENGVIAISNDCWDWTPLKKYYSWLELKNIAYSKDLDLVIAENGTLTAKKEGNGKWQFITDEVGDYITYIDELKCFLKIIFGDVYRSYDGDNWEQITEGYSINCIIYVNSTNTFIAGGTGRILTSTDLQNWTTHSLLQQYDVVSNIAYSKEGNFYIAVTGWNTYKSTNGTNWEFVNSLAGNNFTNVCYVQRYKKMFLIGYNGVAYTTTDGATFTNISFDTEQILYGVTFSEEMNIFIVVGTEGFCCISYDGDNWEEINSNIAYSLLGVVFSDTQNQFIIVGNYLTILESTYILKENLIQNISADSDMNLNLKKGENTIRLTRDTGNFSCRITYRQKYLGV